jgi:hypothetical protein
MGNENLDLFANSNSAKFNEDNGFANFDSACIKPMQPNGYNSNVNGGSSSSGGAGVIRSGEDRYAALKDLDEIFKHGKFINIIYFEMYKYNINNSNCR